MAKLTNNYNVSEDIGTSNGCAIPAFVAELLLAFCNTHSCAVTHSYDEVRPFLAQPLLSGGQTRNLATDYTGCEGRSVSHHPGKEQNFN
ncbi:hypothetical protein TNIN_239641 [Trichonephila inaurata madagascariensis]|uniref:Uncharacterized protein n=1 Tax=Trichonephila inaurata madagascariensis TaxID=2747483 RepID=A0A8X6YJY3_9ARAC|nr:hypothetical protein TNIN_239641 [Trichonephila inaurata madagascariensis]